MIRFLTVGHENKVLVWHADLNSDISEIKPASAPTTLSPLTAIAVSIGLRAVAVAGLGTLFIFDLLSIEKDDDPSTGQVTISPRFSFVAHSTNVVSLKFYSQHSWLVSAGEDGYIRFWDASRASAATAPDDQQFVNGRMIMIKTLQIRGSIKGMAMLGKNIMATCDDKGRIIVWDHVSGERIREVRPIDETFDFWPSKHVIQAIDINKYGIIAAGNNRGDLFILKDELCVTIKSAHSRYVLKAAFSSDGVYLATSSADGVINIFENKNPMQITGYMLSKTLKQPNEWIWDVKFTSNNKHLVSASGSKSVTIWDLETCSNVCLKGHELGILSLEIIPETL